MLTDLQFAYLLLFIIVFLLIYISIANTYFLTRMDEMDEIEDNLTELLDNENRRFTDNEIQKAYELGIMKALEVMKEVSENGTKAD